MLRSDSDSRKLQGEDLQRFVLWVMGGMKGE